MLTFKQAQQIVLGSIGEIGGNTTVPLQSTLLDAGVNKPKIVGFADAIIRIGAAHFDHSLNFGIGIDDLTPASTLHDISIVVFTLGGGRICDKGHPMAGPVCKQCNP